MENLKIRVTNESESREAQELFFALGYYWLYKDIGKNFYYADGDVHLFANKNGVLATGVASQDDFFNRWNGKELTLQELRQLAGKESLNDIYAEIEQVRKEYLDSAKNYTYVQHTAKRSEDWIEIPEGAEVATFNGGQLVFWKNNGELSYSMDFSSYWERSEDGLSTLKEYTDYYGDHVVWSRYTQPDPLPFIDDNPLCEHTDAQCNDNDHTHTNPQQDANNATNANAWQIQVGGNHYKKLKIQPMEYALANKLDYAQANVVKYVTRHADKNGKEDLLKAIHNIQLMIEHYYAN